MNWNLKKKNSSFLKENTNEKLYSEKESLIKLKEQIEVDLIRLRREKNKISAHQKLAGFSQWKAEDSQNGEIFDFKNKGKISRLTSKNLSDWQENQLCRLQIVKKADTETNEELELKIDMGTRFSSPRRAATPKSSDFGRANFKFRGPNSSTKLVFYD